MNNIELAVGRIYLAASKYFVLEVDVLEAEKMGKLNNLSD